MTRIFSRHFRSLGIFAVVLTCILSRLPVLLSPYLILDGDECVVATMTKYLYEGRGHFTLFFWGQDYGFTLLESLSILPFCALLGCGTLAVKLGMLLLWTAGCVFFFLALQQLGQRRWMPLLLTLILAAHPAWALWALKARGGYLTAFCLSNLSLWLLFRPRNHPAVCLLTGPLICLVYQSQPLWLAGLLPLALYALLKAADWPRRLVLTGLSLAAGLTAFHFYKLPYHDNVPFAFHPTLSQLPGLAGRLPGYFFGSLHGNYAFSVFQPPNAFCAAAALLTCLLLFLLAAGGLRSLLWERGRRDWRWLTSLLFIPLTIGYTFLVRFPEGRYLLPVTGYALVSLLLLLRGRPGRRWMNATAAGALLVAFVGTCTFYGFQEDRLTQQSLRELLRELQERDIHATYSTDAMLPWQITFYSNEAVLSRMFYQPGRYPPYTEQVDNTLKAGGKVAVIGYSGEFADLPLRPAWTNKDLFLSPDPDFDMLYQRFYFR